MRRIILPAALTFALLSSAALGADDRVRRTLERLAEESQAFQKTAPDVMAEETLRQKAFKPRRFKRRRAADGAEQDSQWQTREIVSEYSFAMLGEKGEVHEFRKPVSVDGRTLRQREFAGQDLAASIHSTNEKDKKRLLEDFEKLGLIGTVTDFGQLLLLFSRGSQDNYEYEVAGTRMLGADKVIMVRYHQKSGDTGVNVWDQDKLVRERLNGMIYARAEDFVPLRITMISGFGKDDDRVREEAEVDYTTTPFKILLPTAVVHREFRADQLAAENQFSYGAFRKIGTPPK